TTVRPERRTNPGSADTADPPSEPQHHGFDDRTTVPDLLTGLLQGPADGLFDDHFVLQRLALQTAHRVLDALGHVVQHVAQRTVRVARQADAAHVNVAGDAAALIQSEADDQDAVVGRVPALAQGLAALLDQHAAVDEQAARGHFIDNGRGSRRQAHHVAVARRHRLRDLHVFGQIAVLDQVAAHAVGRHGDLRPGPLIHLTQFVAARVARDVDAGVILFGVDAHPALGHLVLQPADGQFVAGNDARREDAVIPLPQLDEGMRPFGHARQSRAGLALAAGAQIQDLVRRPDSGFLFGQAGLEVVQHADRLGGGGDAVHRATGQGHAASGGLCRADHAVHARDVGGEAAHRHPALQALDQLGQLDLYVALGACDAVDEDVGGVADHRQDALVAQLLDEVDVGALAHDRIV